jgi:protein-tyrosine phosphatase
MGISRSSSVVAAYLMLRAAKDGHLLDALDAIEAVRKRRDAVCPNLGFIYQLEEYSRCLKKKYPHATRHQIVEAEPTHNDTLTEASVTLTRVSIT